MSSVSRDAAGTPESPEIRRARHEGLLVGLCSGAVIAASVLSGVEPRGGRGAGGSCPGDDGAGRRGGPLPGPSATAGYPAASLACAGVADGATLGRCDIAGASLAMSWLSWCAAEMGRSGLRGPGD